MTAEYNLPLHVNSQNGDDYVIEDGYPHDGVTPPGMAWDGQGDGGGKFRLKRRRRCGQCGPCQVKENCNKCQYCMRKDVLKQACIYRKCVYLRKPVPRFRQETPIAASQKSTPTPPRKPSSTQAPTIVTNSSNSSSAAPQNVSNSSNTTSAPASALSSPASVPSVSSSHQSELSSCRLNQSPFAALSAMNNSMLDPLRHRMIEHQHRSSLFDTMGHHHSVLDPSKGSLGDMSRYSAGPGAACLNAAHCKLDQGAASMNHNSDMNLAAAAAAAVSPLNSMSSHHSHHQANKTLPPRDPYFSPMDTWSSMPYGLPRPHTWAPPALPNHPAAAAAYGFQQHSTPFPSSFTPSSCRLGLPDSASSRYSSQQHSFHHSMAGFSQDLTHATTNHANHSSMRSPINTPFYPTAPHITPSSIPTFTSLGQFAPNQAGFGPTAYPMHPHAHMYPGGFYSTFRTATEPQIYHAQIFPSQNPFKHLFSLLPTLSSNYNAGKGDYFDDKEFNLNIYKDIGKLDDFFSSISHGPKEAMKCPEGRKDSIPSPCKDKSQQIRRDSRKVINIAECSKKRSRSNKTETKMFVNYISNIKGSQKPFQNNLKDQEMFQQVNELSCVPQCQEVEEFMSSSHRLSDDIDISPVEIHFPHVMNELDLSDANMALPPEPSSCSSSSCPPFTPLNSTTAFTSPNLWPSSASDHSAELLSSDGHVHLYTYRSYKKSNWISKQLCRIRRKYLLLCNRNRAQSKTSRRCFVQTANNNKFKINYHLQLKRER
ncbi:ras guanine nucleotide exchange factor K [Biomphalaria glabrata]